MTLSRNSEKLTKIRQNEHMIVNFRLEAPSPVRSYPKIANYCRKLHFFVGGWKELTLMSLSRKFGKINKVRQSEHIFGTLTLQASICIHSHTKMGNFCRIMQTFEGGQNELTLMTLSQKSRKTNKNFKVNTLSTFLAFKHLVAPIATQKIVGFCRIMQFFEGDQKERTSMTRSQNVEKISKFRQSEHFCGNFSFQAHSYPKIITFCRKVQIFVCDQNELALMNL